MTTEQQNQSAVLDTLTKMYETAPNEAVVSMLDRELKCAALGAIARLSVLTQGGPVLPVEKLFGELGGLTGIVNGALDMEAQVRKGAQNPTTATTRQIAEDIAALVDKGIKRVLLQEQEMSHDAFLDITEGHATMLRGLERLSIADESGNG